MKWSVLDQSPAAQGRTQDVAIRESLALARLCDALGYHRYWVSEHHNSASIVGTAPEILMAAIAATTRRIRVGSAGVMLPHYSALKVAEQFRVLEAHRPGPDRPGRGPRAGLGPADRVCAESARQCGRRVPAAGARAAVLGRGHSAAGRPSVPRDRGASAGPDQPRDLDPRQLRLRRAARRAFRPAVCVRLFLQRRPGRGRGARALPAQLPPERALSGADRDDLRLGARGGHRSRSAAAADDARILARRFRAGPAQSAGVARAGRRASVHRIRACAHRGAAPQGLRRHREGSGQQAHELAQRLELQEIVINTWTYDPAARRRSYELLAAEFGLAPAAHCSSPATSSDRLPTATR